MPNTHRRRRRNSTVELSRVGATSAVCIELTTSSRRLPTKIWKLNTLRIYPVELSRVELCRRCVHARRMSWPSLQFCSLWLAQKIGNRVMTDDWCVHTADTMQLYFFVGKLFRLVETVANWLRIQYTAPTWLNSTVESRRRCVLGFRRLI